MNGFVIRLFENSLFMSAAILLLLVLGSVLQDKTPPGLRYACWLLVAIGLLVPCRPNLVTFRLPQKQPVASTAEVFPDAVTFVTQMENMTGHTRDRLTQWDQPPETVPYYMSEKFAAGAAALRGEAPVAVSHSAFKAWAKQWLLFCLWLLGALVFVGICTLRHIRFMHEIKKRSRPADNPRQLRIFGEVRRTVRLKRKVSLRVCPVIVSPVMLGVFRPVIILLDEAVDDDTLRLMLMHEALHIKRGDLVGKALSLAAWAAHWFNPFAYLLQRTVAMESELACDRSVLYYAGSGKRFQYGNTILRTAKRGCQAAGSLGLALTGDGKKLKKRLSSILITGKPNRWAAVCGAVVLLLALSFTGGLVGCTGEASTLPSVDSLTEGAFLADGGTLRIALVYDDTVFKKALDLFNERFPSWTVEVIPCSEIVKTGSNTTLIPIDIDKASLLRSGEADLINLHTSEVYGLQKENLLENLSLLSQMDDETSLGRMLPGIRNVLNTENGLYYRPVSFTTYELYINYDYSDIRMDEPPESWTWQEMAEWLRADKERQNAQALLTDTAASLTNRLLSFYSGYFIDPNTGLYDFNSPVFKEMLYAVKMLENGGLLWEKEEDWQNAFAGSMAYIGCYGDRVTDFKTYKNQFGIKVLPLPTIPGAEGMAAEIFSTFAVNALSGGEEKTAAWEFIKILLSDEVQNGGLVWGGATPVLNELTAEGVVNQSGGGIAVNGIVSGQVPDHALAAYNRDRQAYYEKINRIVLYGNRLDDLYPIILRNAQLFYDDKLSYDECVDQIQAEAALLPES